MKKPYYMGKDARARNTPLRFNPFDFDGEEKKNDSWANGWFDKDLELFLDSKLGKGEYEKLNRKLYRQ